MMLLKSFPSCAGEITVVCAAFSPLRKDKLCPFFGQSQVVPRRFSVLIQDAFLFCFGKIKNEIFGKANMKFASQMKFAFGE